MKKGVKSPIVQGEKAEIDRSIKSSAEISLSKHGQGSGEVHSYQIQLEPINAPKKSRENSFILLPRISKIKQKSNEVHHGEYLREIHKFDKFCQKIL